jgi:hypothetical protein
MKEAKKSYYIIAHYTESPDRIAQASEHYESLKEARAEARRYQGYNVYKVEEIGGTVAYVYKLKL